MNELGFTRIGVCTGLFVLLMFSSLEAGEFDFNWRFCKGDFPSAMMPGFDDADWRTVDLPHDWSIEGPFGPEYASGSGYVPGGIGWYRKHFKLDTADKDRRVEVEFDGVYNNSEVWINGHFVGRRPCGYSSFYYDLTPHVKFDDAQNVIAVRVDHTQFADSRWYTGSGIYRHVRLHISEMFHIGHWGIYVTTPEISDASAVVRVETIVRNDHDGSRTFSLESSVVMPNGSDRSGQVESVTLEAGTERTFVQEIKVTKPQLWSIDSPTLYTLKSCLKIDGELLEERSTPFGIRTIRFDPDEGFFLNGKSVKIKGVCLHHDAGCLGAAVPDKVLERRLRLVKALGANAIRTSHNPPAPELLDMCDRLGLLVKDEAFDEFTPPKNKWVEGWNAGQPSRFGYGEVFTEWSVRDMEDLVRRDRNHPCVIMWSIGNEIDYANDPFSHPVLGDNYRPDHPRAENLVKYAKPLVTAVKKWDKTRPVTAALANIPMSNAVGLPELLDVVGYNYQEKYYEVDHQTYPNRFIFGSENGDAYNAWTAVRDNAYVAGQFLWTGIDYLGEARQWPSRANGSGLLDLCGFKKPIGWFRQSLWSDEPMVYLCVARAGGRRGRGGWPAEHWNWQADSELNVICYTNCPEVSLTLNGQSLGVKSLSDAVQGMLIWKVGCEPGELKAVGREDGQPVCQFALKTAGEPNRIILSPDVTKLTADGQDICHIAFEIVDEQGVCIYEADHELTFDIEGPAKIIGIENGDLRSIDNPKDSIHKAYHGRGLAILQAARKPGKVRVIARAKGLIEAAFDIDVVGQKR